MGSGKRTPGALNTVKLSLTTSLGFARPVVTTTKALGCTIKFR